MSDPVTNVEIEDVLTSIRRLVSEAGPAAEATPAAPAAAAERQTASQETPEEPPKAAIQDKLVLTPALRVVSGDDEPAEEAAAASDDADASLAETLSFLQSGLAAEVPGEGDASDNAAPIEADEPHDITDADHDTTEMAVSAADIFASEDLAPADELADDKTDADAAAFTETPLTDETRDEDALLPNADNDADTQEPVKDQAGFDADEGIALSEAQSLDSRIVQWEHVSDPDILAYEPDAPGDSDYAGTEIESLSWIEALAKAQIVDPSTGSHEKQPDSATEAPTDTIAPETQHEDTIDMPEDDLSVREGGADAPDLALSGKVDQIEAEAQEIFGHAVEQAIAPEPGAAESDESVLLDEAMLRDLINDIVVQELQGALGERITRNVRKLVRREIHRALAAHDVK